MLPPIDATSYRATPSLQTKFTTGDDNHVGDDYFLTSGDKIRYFLEEDAVAENGKLTREKSKAVNKIGHGELRPCHLEICVARVFRVN